MPLWLNVKSPKEKTKSKDAQRVGGEILDFDRAYFRVEFCLRDDRNCVIHEIDGFFSRFSIYSTKFVTFHKKQY